MPFAEDLLEQARHLARREPKKPKQASLRRAVSTAYYALFHLLISEAVKNWRRPKDRPALARMFDHGSMNRACRELPKKSGLPIDLREIAQTFVDMQQHRHRADYDGSAKWTRTDVIEKVDLVGPAFKSWYAIRKDSLAQDFLVSLLIKERKS